MILFWQWCKRTLFTVKWWRDHWWLPFALLGFTLLWVVTIARSTSPLVNLTKQINDIKEKDRKETNKIKRDKEDKIKTIDSKLEKDKNKVVKETEEKIEKLKDKIKEDDDKINGDSEHINSIFNDVIED